MNKYFNPISYYNYFLRNNLIYKALFYLIKYPNFAIYIPSWIKSQNKGSPITDKTPWITYGALGWIKKNIRSSMVAFEWGSGGSTLYLVNRVQKLISVEHNETWFSEVKSHLKLNNIHNYQYNLVKPDIDYTNKDNLNVPDKYKSSDKGYLNYNFKNYCQFIERFPDNYFDLIIIDGRARPSCILHSVNKVRYGGYILVDDSEREIYNEGFKLLRNFKRTDFYGPGPYLNFPWATSIFQRTN